MSEVLERRAVSRKTPGDGKHELTAETAARLQAIGAPLPLVVDGVADEGRIVPMPCTCRGTSHEHWFLEAAALRGMGVGREAIVAIAADGRTVEVRTE
jgi:hypothetical protein